VREASKATTTPTGFVQVERAFLKHVSLSPNARWLGTILASFANSRRLAWPGVPLLRNLTGLGMNRLTAARAELVRGGYLRMTRTRDKRRRFAHVEYELSERILHQRALGGAKMQ
jgi:hypothetical protein